MRKNHVGSSSGRLGIEKVVRRHAQNRAAAVEPGTGVEKKVWSFAFRTWQEVLPRQQKKNIESPSAATVPVRCMKRKIKGTTKDGIYRKVRHSMSEKKRTGRMGRGAGK